MIFKLTSIEVKQSKGGKPFATTFWNDGQGEQKALMFKGFEGLKVGDEVEGKIAPWKDAFVFNPTEHETHIFFKGVGGYKNMQMDKAMDKKAENVEKAQNHTDESVKRAAAFRDSSQFVIEFMRHQEYMTEETWTEQMWAKHKELRERYMREWEKDDVPFH